VTCDPGAVCGVGGGCVDTHCNACDGDEKCGPESACLATGADGATEDRCLRACEVDADCDDAQTCAAHPDGSRRCYDADGACAAPGVEPGPDADPVEPGPEQVVDADPLEPGPEPVPDADPVEPALDASMAEVIELDAGVLDAGSIAEPTTPSRESGGCSGSGGAEPLAGLLAMLALGRAARGRRRP
jgi:hypothetical protein